ncbi:MAG: type II toxin-antitoxin system prevent-host-death family antitoxin [Acetobacteraceae bacterium]|jgi:prevent-host-death family protein
MEKVIPAAEANRQFSRILRGVRKGDSVTITSNGRPVARLVPAPTKGTEAAKQRLLAYLRSLPIQDIEPWTREELYD